MPPSMSKPPPALADETLEQAHLVLGEKLGFQIVEDDRAILEQLLGRLGKAVAQFEFVDGIQAREYRWS